MCFSSASARCSARSGERVSSTSSVMPSASAAAPTQAVRYSSGRIERSTTSAPTTWPASCSGIASRIAGHASAPAGWFSAIALPSAASMLRRSRWSLASTLRDSRSASR